MQNSEIYSVLAKSSYIKGAPARHDFVHRYHGDRFTLLPQFTNAENTTYFDNKTGDVVLSVRGTDIRNAQSGRTGDLGTDILVTLGLEKLSGRYKRSEKLLKKIKNEHPDHKVVTTGHSMGATISKELSHKYNLESHNFAPGITFPSINASRYKMTDPKVSEKRKKIHNYIVIGGGGAKVDPISVSSIFSPFETTHIHEPKNLTKEEMGIHNQHSIFHFFPNVATQ
jgi:hypothetical protein